MTSSGRGEIVALLVVTPDNDKAYADGAVWRGFMAVSADG